MYRSRPVVLVIFAAAAACSARTDTESVDGLAKDTTLARFGLDRRALPLPAACGAIATSARSGVVDEPRAAALARQAYASELVGHVREARSLLSRALELDGSSPSVAYHLGRTSESLGDRDGATSAYCRYLSLTSVASGAADARLRLTRLSQHSTSTSGMTTTTAVRAHASVATRAPVRLASRPHGHEAPRDVDVMVAASTPVPVTREPATVPSSARRGPTRVQGAGVGAVAGAILGAAAGRSVRSAVIGAAAGGILGTMVTGGSR